MANFSFTVANNDSVGFLVKPSFGLYYHLLPSRRSPILLLSPCCTAPLREELIHRTNEQTISCYVCHERVTDQVLHEPAAACSLNKIEEHLQIILEDSDLSVLEAPIVASYFASWFSEFYSAVSSELVEYESSDSPMEFSFNGDGFTKI